MKGKFRRAWIRDANRAGRRERVKFAELRSAFSDNGGRPCLDSQQVIYNHTFLLLT